MRRGLFDIANAYYMVVRELAVGNYSDESVVRLLALMGLPAEAATELEGYLGEVAALADAGVPAHLIAATAEARAATWGVSQGCAKVAQSRRGSRPGDPLADAMFGFVFGRCRARARGRLRAEGLLASVPWTGRRDFGGEDGPVGEEAVELGEVAYADDTALPVIGPAATILERVTAAGAVVLRGFWGHGWRPNLKDLGPCPRPPAHHDGWRS